MNKAQQVAKRKRAQFHTATQAKRKRDALTEASEAAKRARKPERKSIVTQMNDRGYTLDVRGPDAEHIAMHGAKDLTPRTSWFRRARAAR